MGNYKVRDIPDGSCFSEPVYLDERFIIASPVIPVSDDLKKLLLKWEFLSLISAGIPQEPKAEAETPADVQETDEDERIVNAMEFYTTLRGYTEEILVQFSTNGVLNYEEIKEKTRGFCGIISRERRYLLRVLQHAGIEDKVRYLSSHEAKSTVLSVIIGIYMKLDEESLVDLGVAAIVHEVGMINIPENVYQNAGPLTREEQRAILSHPILGFNMLKSLNFPQNIRLAVLEHHERENGSGYPQRLSGDKISLYAKIIAVACSYEAITAARSFRTAQDSHSGILNLLKNEGGRYDEHAIRALVFSLSVYPIGAYVLLSDGRKAQVVDANTNAPKYPIVQALDETEPLETSPVGVRIVRVIPPPAQ
jgi:HD-GYP domain-containing protein (c-di-GMP phosphodiesterase class II)